jgi:hypothetical protein
LKTATSAVLKALLLSVSPKLWGLSKTPAILFYDGGANSPSLCYGAFPLSFAETRMDRGTRIALVVSLVWVLGWLWVWAETCQWCRNGVDTLVIFCLTPLSIYWAYRFIRSGKPSKINQPE